MFQSPCSCIRNALMSTAMATKSLKIVIFNHLMPIVMINSKVPKPDCGLERKVSVALKKTQLLCAYARILGTPVFQILYPPLHGMLWLP